MNQISMMMKKRWSAEGREEEEELGNNSTKNKVIKLQSSSSSMIQHQNTSSSSLLSSWSDLELDMMREIDNKLCYGDHIRFRGVCKSWRAGCVKRAADALPWLMLLLLDMEKRLVYKLYEPPSLNPIKSDDDASSSTIISGAINLPDYFDDIPSYISCVDGWVNIAVFNFKPKNYGFLFFSVATRASFTLPQLNVSTRPIYLGLSTTPDSPDCVFLALCLTNEFRRTIGIFRHGDTHWTTTQSVGGWFWKPKHITVVFIRGVFYFFFDVGIGSYDFATGLLKVDDYSAVLEFSEIYKFFGLDGDLMLAYYEKETLKFCIRKYDWSNKVWVPLQSLAGRSMYLTSVSVYVDQRNYYGISSSANKIYVRVTINEETCRVDEYTLEDGQLTKCPSARWGSYTSFNIWLCPPDVLLRK